MSKDLRPLEAKDLEHLKIDPDGNLYWRGERVRTGGWSRGERIAFAALLIAALGFAAALVTNFRDIRTNAGEMLGFVRRGPASTEAPGPRE